MSRIKASELRGDAGLDNYLKFQMAILIKNQKYINQHLIITGRANEINPNS